MKHIGSVFMNIRNIISALLLFVVLFYNVPQLNAQSVNDSIVIREVYDTALVNGKTYELLRQLTKDIGPRLSGSANAEKAVAWGKQVMEQMQFDTVWLQEVRVPHWERGKAEKVLLREGNKGKELALHALALGGSPGTGAKGVSAPVVQVNNFDELDNLGKAGVAGKIVFFNFPMNQEHIVTGRAYGEAAAYRTTGPSRAARLGAVGAVVRSLSTAYDKVPHTGTTRFEEGITPIPALAISTWDAEMLSKKIKIRQTANALPRNPQPHPARQAILQCNWRDTGQRISRENYYYRRPPGFLGCRRRCSRRRHWGCAGHGGTAHPESHRL